jgi:hypothetical protein
MKRFAAMVAAPFRLAYRFWTEPVPPYPLALFRILLGICLLLNLWTTIVPSGQLLLGDQGLCPAAANDDYLHRSGRVCLLRGPVAIPFAEKILPAEWTRAWADWGATPQAAYLVFALFTVGCALMTLGFWTRTATIASWLLFLTIYQRLNWTMNGGDDVARMGLFYLIFCRSGAVWSLDHARALRRQPDDPTLISPLVPAWPLRLMQIQICMVYLFTGLIKLGDGFFSDSWLDCDWINGQALYWLFNDMELNRWPYSWTPFPMWFCRLLTWSVMTFELGFVVLVMNRRTRPWVLLFGVLMHLGIWLHTEIAFFSPFMLCWYALFIRADRARSAKQGRATNLLKLFTHRAFVRRARGQHSQPLPA